MTNVRSLIVAATAALLLIAAGACASDGEGPSSTESPTPPRAPSSTPTTTAPATASQAAATAASNVVRKYFVVVDRLGQKPSAPLEQLARVATSIQLSAQTNLLTQQRGQGLKQTGDTAISDLKVQSINLDNSDPSTGKIPTATVDVCWDVTDVDVVDSSGKSTVSPSRPDSGWTRYTVANHHWAKQPDQGWRVASGQDLERSPCNAS